MFRSGFARPGKMNGPRLALVAASFTLFACGCGDSDDGVAPIIDAAPSVSDSSTVDTAKPDTQPAKDAGAQPDTAAPDAPAADSAEADAGVDSAPIDATAPDVAVDAAADLAVDVGVDAAAPDVAVDAAEVDSAAADAAIDANLDPGPPTLTNIFGTIVMPRCGMCHGKVPPVGLSNLLMMTKDQMYTNLVNVMAAGLACGPAHGAVDGGTDAGGDDGGSDAGDSDAGAADASAPVDAGPLPIRVVPGDSAHSLLYEKISSATPSCGKRMPIGQVPLTLVQIDLIKQWIDKGAPND
jgi:hypothetical protein